MFVKKISVKNFRLFQSGFSLDESQIAIPDGTNAGSGLTVLVGENGVGKSSLLDAIAYPLISYKAESLQLNDFTDIRDPIEIELSADVNFPVKRSMSGDFQAKGFKFTAKVRQQNSNRYLVGTCVSDTQFVPADGVSINANSPDLRTSVENPFAGPRFSENDYLLVDRNRTKTLETGTYSTTRFDRILDNLNFLYLRANNNEPLNLHDSVDALINPPDTETPIKNDYLSQAFEEFRTITGYEVGLSIIEDAQPYKKAFVAFRDLEHKQIPIEKIGSGYQMFLALICQQKLSLQSGKKLIILIDEVELHLHPKLQKSLVELLLDVSKQAQVIITTHSPELLKDLQKCNRHKINALVRQDDSLSINPINEFVLPLPTVSETNYVAFDLASMEYFIELYNQFGEVNSVNSIAGIDQALGVADADKVDWEREDGTIQRLSKYSCIRNKFHHPSNRLNDGKFGCGYDDVREAIEFLRSKL